MSDLFSLLSLGSAGIAAQNTGAGVAQNNVANVNTIGYSRQRVDLEALARLGGVRSGTPQRLEDSLLGARMRTSAGSLAMSQQTASALGDLETRLTETGPTIHESFSTLMARLHLVAASPTDSTLRTSVVDAVRELAANTRNYAAELEQACADANQRVKDNIAAASELAHRLADTNLQIARGGDAALEDAREQLAQQLSQLVGGAARIDGDGQMRFVLEGGAVLVDGTHAATLAASPNATTNNTDIAVVDGSTRRDVTTQVGGRLGADVRFRDGSLATAQNDLDQLAFDIASQLDGTHAANVALDGTTGNHLFAVVSQVRGAAKALAIDPVLDADPGKLATRAPGAGPGDNGGALALIGLGPALANRSIDLVARVASDSARARSDVKRDELVDEHLTQLRDSIAGVDIQEELANLARFQHASSAMTKFVSTIDDMLGDLIDRL